MRVKVLGGRPWRFKKVVNLLEDYFKGVEKNSLKNYK